MEEDGRTGVCGDSPSRARRSGQSPAAYWRNLTAAAPLRWKAQRWLANMLRRARRRSTCCGHPGEPGC